MRISDWSSDVCSSVLTRSSGGGYPGSLRDFPASVLSRRVSRQHKHKARAAIVQRAQGQMPWAYFYCLLLRFRLNPGRLFLFWAPGRSEEHTSELQSLMRISYAVFCLKKKTTQSNH